MTMIYNDPAGGSPSSMGPQLRIDFYKKKALIDEAKEMYFGQMADATTMPKHFGKEIKCYHYLPLLDDANINDQGIDAQGLIADGTVGAYKVTIEILLEGLQSTGNGYVTLYATGEATVEADALTAAQVEAVRIFKSLNMFTTNYATSKAAIIAAGGTVTENAGVPATGNLYGSSKDVGTIVGKLPLLSETGGRVNRVGFKRIELKSNLQKLGFFDEYTQESLDFDTDSELMTHINREMLRGANEITEDMLQIDLLNGAGVVRLGGDATKTTEITAEGTISVLSYEDFMRLAIDLDNNRCPKNTTLISGSRMIDTKVINAARYAYIGSELEIMIKQMKDGTDKVFVPVAQYASAGNVARGELGSIDNFRIIVVPEMMHWEGAGDLVGTNPGYRSGIAPAGHADHAGSECYNVYPILVVGGGSFTTVGFQTSGKNSKFTIYHKPPGKDIADRNDPFGEVGFMSIKWYYGFMLLRPERIALGKCVAKW